MAIVEMVHSGGNAIAVIGGFKGNIFITPISLESRNR
jgi:hypothetical protein